MKSVKPVFVERFFRAFDLDNLDRIEKEAGAARWSRRQIVQVADDPDHETRVVATEMFPDQAVGFFVIHRAAGHHAAGGLYICNLAVARPWRRLGVATFALSAIERIARESGCGELSLDVQEENLAAQLLYQKAGFMAVEIWPNYYGNQDGYRMTKKLNASACAGSPGPHL